MPHSRLSLAAFLIIAAVFLTIISTIVGGRAQMPQHSGLVVTITSPAHDGVKLLINDLLPVSAAVDRDDGDESASNALSPYGIAYEIAWSATAGRFAETYGPNATYLAPDYMPGCDVLDIIITATAVELEPGFASDSASARRASGKVLARSDYTLRGQQ